MGLKEDPQTFLEGIATSEEEKAEALQWADFVENWEIAGPYLSGSQDAVHAPEEALKNAQSQMQSALETF